MSPYFNMNPYYQNQGINYGFNHPALNPYDMSGLFAMNQNQMMNQFTNPNQVQQSPMPNNTAADVSLSEESLPADEAVTIKKKVVGGEIKKVEKVIPEKSVAQQVEELVQQRLQQERQVQQPLPQTVIPTAQPALPPAASVEYQVVKPTIQEQREFIRDVRYPFIDEAEFNKLYQEVMDSIRNYPNHSTLNVQHQIFYFDPELQVKLIKESKANGYYCYIREDGILLEKVFLNNRDMILDAVFSMANRVLSEYSLYKGVSIFPNE